MKIIPRPNPPRDITIRLGLELIYETALPTTLTLLIKPQPGPFQSIQAELFSFLPHTEASEFADTHGNLCHRMTLAPGRTSIRHDALVDVPSATEDHTRRGEPVPVEELPPDLLRYTLPSRYCDSDKLLDFAFEHFGQIPHGFARVQAICDWVHQHIEYRFGAGNPRLAASEIIAQRYGVCRDFAHTAIGLCRTFNLPARYLTGYVPDVGYLDPGTPMDFHAYFEVYIGHQWHVFDARFNVPRIGRIVIGRGCDAVDGAFGTVYGAAELVWFHVWAYQVDPAEVNPGDPIDLTKRLDGTPELRFPTKKRVAC
ncbi:MAG: transglutaminase family protein [Verrucomicrobiota bacterium]|nr:transglutaminase family protein [Verrucomicrobiota bacterium]